MVDISDPKWSEVDASNSSASPDGIQGGYAPSTVAPILRGTRGAIKRSYNRINAIYTSTGTAAAQVLTFAQAPSAYVKGERIAYFPNATNTGAMTLNINGLGAKSILRHDGTALVAGDITSGAFTEVVYDGAAFQLVSLQQVDAADITKGTLSDARLPSTMSSKTLSGNLNINVATTTTGAVFAQTAGSNRWGFGKDGSAESGSNAGSNFFINRYNDAGTYVDTPFQISRTNGAVGITGSLTVNGGTVWHSGNDGAGSTLDADLLDGQQGSYYLSASNLNAGTVPNARISGSYDGIDILTANRLMVLSTTDASLTSTGHGIQVGPTNGGNLILDGNEIMSRNNGAADALYINNDGGSVAIGSGGLTIAGGTAWHANNDGAGSGLDADLLDGQQGSYYLSASNLNAGTVPTARLTGTYGISISGNAATATSATSATSASSAAKLTTARTISLTGDATGSVSFDGSANAAITVTVADDSHNHTIANIDNLQTTLNGKLNLSGGTMTGNLTVQNSAPKIDLYDSTSSAWNGRITVDGNNLYIQGSSDNTTYNTKIQFELDTNNVYFAGNKLIFNGTAVPLNVGGTGATTAAAARTNLGLGNLATLDSPMGTWSQVTRTTLTVYQNTTGRIKAVSVKNGDNGCSVYVHSSSGLNQSTFTAYNSDSRGDAAFMIVPPNWYYMVIGSTTFETN